MPEQPSAPRLRIGFILARRFTLSAFANFVDVLRLAADEGDRSRPIRCSWKVLSASMRPIVSSCGIHVQPDEPLGEPSRFDYIVVVGGLIEAMDDLDAEYVRFLRGAAQAGIGIVGLCTGAFILHRAGLMQGYRCCVHWFHHEDFLEQFEGITPISNQIFVVDRDRLTCSGGASAAHLAAFLVDRHIGRAVAQKSLHIMIIDDQMSEDMPQPGTPLELTTRDPLVKKALLLFQQALHSPPSVDEVAGRLGVSRRKLERHFRQALNMSPADAGMTIRVGHARQLLMNRRMSITQVAVESGFCDASHFIRAFRARSGLTPQAFRNQLA